ncbi:GAF domain-containing protein [Sedimenticola sp.]|uniref:GAF domain-containing protein n=1 Tax=Sedimenticola sp. TaxID=1940285 RepID=UPI003D128821
MTAPHTITLESIRDCLEGVIPSVIATCSPDGLPNIAYLSQVHFVDNRHVALSFQFFNKTRENILANPQAVVQVVDHNTASHYRLSLRYLHTETEGPLFEKMKGKLAGIASHTGMSKVFRLLGADVYEVLNIEGIRGNCSLSYFHTSGRLTALRACSSQLAKCADLDTLLDETLACLNQHFSIDYSILLMFDKLRQHLYTVTSFGYENSGIGSEIPLGTGIIGVAARERTPIRIMYSTGEYSYSRALRDNLQRGGALTHIETEIPFPGLKAPGSQLAVPIISNDDLLGILYVESPLDMRFTYKDEEALLILGEQLALAFRLLQQVPETLLEKRRPETPLPVRVGEAMVIRHYKVDNSCFIDNDYLIKGVAGAIFWKLLRDYSTLNRTDFSNRELRLDPSIGLPEIGDNLEARLILLQKRLTERSHCLRIEKTGRGRFRLQVERPVRLEESA